MDGWIIVSWLGQHGGWLGITGGARGNLREIPQHKMLIAMILLVGLF